MSAPITIQGAFAPYLSSIACQKRDLRRLKKRAGYANLCVPLLESYNNWSREHSDNVAEWRRKSESALQRIGEARY